METVLGQNHKNGILTLDKCHTLLKRLKQGTDE